MSRTQRVRLREVQACIAMPHGPPRWAGEASHGNDACTCEQVPKATSLLLKALAEWIAAQLEPRASPIARSSIVAELRALVDLPPLSDAPPHTPPGDACNGCDGGHQSSSYFFVWDNGIYVSVCQSCYRLLLLHIRCTFHAYVRNCDLRFRVSDRPVACFKKSRVGALGGSNCIN